MATPTTGGSTSSVPFTGDPLIDGLIIGEKWGGALGAAATVTYSFPDFDSFWSTDPDIGYGAQDSGQEPWDSEYRGLNATEQNAVRIAMQAWGAVANINPLETVDGENVVGDIRIAFTTMDSDTYAYAYTPVSGAPYAGDVWLNPDPPVPAGLDFSTGAAGYNTIIHELGHALGLDHPFDHDDPSLDLPVQFDTFKYTVMSYSDAPGHIDAADSSFYPTTPMLLDIQALQYLYGPNTTHHTGNNTYVFEQGVNYYQTIWDAGGIDTIRYNATTDGAEIDLRAGQFSQLGKAISLSNGTMQHDDVAIAYGVIIENATGGGGRDKIIGNIVANVLNGGAGTDTMSGGAGNDTYVVNLAADTVTEPIGGGTDLVRTTAASYALPANVENLRLTGAGSLSATGNGLANVIYANAGDNAINGGAGADTVSYQFGPTAGVTVNLAAIGAQATGGSGSDTLSAIERLTGSNYADRLTGNYGNNALKGLGGNDNLFGRGGNDVLAGGAGQDKFNFTTVLDAGTNVDRITDFNVADDIVRLDNDIFTAFTAVNVALAGSAFRKGAGVTAAQDTSDRIIYDTNSGNLYYDADGVNGAAATLFATLTTHPAITAADFFIVS
jgi:serralysin